MDLLPASFLIVSAAFTAFGISRLMSTRAWTRTTGEVTGTSGGDSIFQPYRHASFRFTTSDGTTHEVTSPDGATVRPTVGKPVRVAYDPASPTNARIDSFMSRGIWMFLVGDIALAVGIALLFLR